MGERKCHQELEAVCLLLLLQRCFDGADGIRSDQSATLPAICLADPRKEEAQVIIHLGRRPHGGSRVPRVRLLLDRHRRTHPPDEIDIGLIHPLQKLSGV